MVSVLLNGPFDEEDVLLVLLNEFDWALDFLGWLLFGDFGDVGSFGCFELLVFVFEFFDLGIFLAETVHSFDVFVDGVSKSSFFGVYCECSCQLIEMKLELFSEEFVLFLIEFESGLVGGFEGFHLFK